MFNKKVLAVALATAFTSGAQAAIDLESTDSQLRTYAADAILASDIDDGMVVITEEEAAAADFLDATANLGFTIGEGTNKYIRIQLDNAMFTADSNVTLDVGGIAGELAQGGNGQNFAVFEVAPEVGEGDLVASDMVTVSVDEYAIDADGATASVSYALYETAVGATNPGTVPSLDADSADFARVATVGTGNFATANDEEATVASGFTLFSGSTLGAGTNMNVTTGALGEIDTDALLGAAGAFNLDGSALTDETVLSDGPYTLRLVGNTDFGNFTLETGATDCAMGGASTDFEDGEITGLAGATIASDSHLVCVTVDGETVIPKGSYSIVVEGDSGAMLENDLGMITYDTTSIEVPYLTTFEDYNQRIILVNNGSTDAGYSFSFTTEEGTEATAGDMATGTIPAGSTLVLRATDVVTLDGRTRTSAMIEVEGVDMNVQAATQTVNMEDGTTDTVVLNANSITSGQ